LRRGFISFCKHGPKFILEVLTKMNPLQRLRQLIAAVEAKIVSWLELWSLKKSCLDYIDGVAICDITISQGSKDGFLDLTRQAMALIKSLDARRYRRVCQQLDYIANTALISRGQYGRKLKICRVDYPKNFTSPYPQRNVREYAGVLIHEATHGLLFEKGIPYNKETRERVERLCHLESYRFALHFEPGYADLYPGPYNPEPHKRSWERSSQARRAVWWKRLQEAFRESKASNPKSAHDYNERGASYLRKRDYDKAIVDFDHAIQLDPKDARFHMNRGTAYMQKREYDKAIVDFDHAIQLDPKDARVHMNRGTAYMQKRDYDKAIADYDRAIQLDPKNARFYLNRGSVYLQKRDYDKAIAAYDHAIQLDPKDARAYVNRGTAYMRKRDYDKTIADYDHAIQLNPRDATVYKNLAWLLATCPQAGFRDGRKAVEHATKACALSEWKDPNAVRTLAAACAEAGDFENAVKWESQFLGTPDQIAKAMLNAESRLSLYQAHKPYHEDRQPSFNPKGNPPTIPEETAM
jgi:tetratricopeptide (TPR) repeat protein